MESKSETVLIIALIIVLLFLFSGFGMMGSYGIGGMMQGIFGIGFGFMWFFMILIIILLVLLIIWLVKQIQNKGGRK